MTDRITCDGAGPHDNSTRKVYPMGAAGNAILCLRCWARERSEVCR